MTNEEAIAHLKERNENLVTVAKDENVYDYEKQVIEADCMRSYFEVNEKAIQALEQQPCDTPRNNLANTSQDCISRAEVLECAYLLTDDEGITHEVVHADDIRYAAPVTWSGWTPATQPPEPNTAVLLYVRYKSTGRWTYQLGMWNDSKQTWEDWRTPYQLEEEFEVVAWMELPEKYEEDNNEW